MMCWFWSRIRQLTGRSERDMMVRQAMEERTYYSKRTLNKTRAEVSFAQRLVSGLEKDIYR